VLVSELFEEGQTLPPQPLGRVPVAGEGEAAAVSAQGIGAHLRRDRFGTGEVVEARQRGYRGREPSRPMEAGELVRPLELFERAGIAAWLDGGGGGRPPWRR
jgi:hypothetical protein